MPCVDEVSRDRVQRYIKRVGISLSELETLRDIEIDMGTT